MNDIKKIKKQLWEAYYSAEDAGQSKAVKYAIIDVMVLMDKEQENSEKTEVCS
jgi:hypothetical protein